MHRCGCCLYRRACPVLLGRVAVAGGLRVGLSLYSTMVTTFWSAASASAVQKQMQQFKVSCRPVLQDAQLDVSAD